MITFNTADLQDIFNEFQSEVKKKLKKWIEESLKELKDEVIKLTPIDTGVFIKENKEKTIIKKWEIVWELTNKTPYWLYVEDSKRVKNYHKWKVVIFRGKWNKTYERSLKNKEKQVFKIIEKNLD